MNFTPLARSLIYSSHLYRKGKGIRLGKSLAEAEKKKVWIYTNEWQARDSDFIEKVMQACQIPRTDYGIKTVGGKELRREEVPSAKDTIFLLFGLNPDQEKIFSPSILLPFIEKKEAPFLLLALPAIPSFQDNKEAKKKLWNALKKLFRMP